jgi:hypothetical protein
VPASILGPKQRPTLPVCPQKGALPSVGGQYDPAMKPNLLAPAFRKRESKDSGKEVSRKANRAVRWIGDRPPRVWGAFYILLIPLGGLIFWTLPAGSFYDSNLTREAGYKQDLVTAASLLVSAIQNQEYGEGTGHPLANPTWDLAGIRMTLDPVSVTVPAASVSVDTAGNMALTIQGWAQSPPGASAYATGNVGDPVVLSAGSPTITSSRPGSSPLVGYTVTFATSTIANPFGPPSGASDGNGQIPLNILLPGADGETAINPDASVLWMPPSTAAVIQRLSAAGSGDPKEASGLFIRMCYFSATTVTTLGFGDITPVSTWARVLSAAEAVLGVVIIGLFLNAVAQKWRKS